MVSDFRAPPFAMARDSTGNTFVVTVGDPTYQRPASDTPGLAIGMPLHDACLHC